MEDVKLVRHPVVANAIFLPLLLCFLRLSGFVIKQLMETIHLLEARVHKLEKTSPVMFMQQADQLQHDSLFVCGPDMPDHLQNFSIDGVIQELQEQALDLYKLFMQFFDIKVNVPPDISTNNKESKGVTSLCTVLNRVQLLISMMLIA